jgi:hypothetical protein
VAEGILKAPDPPAVLIRDRTGLDRARRDRGAQQRLRVIDDDQQPLRRPPIATGLNRRRRSDAEETRKRAPATDSCAT